MATLAQIRNAVDSRLAALWPTVQAKQDNYAANHNGRYWQGLKTHLINPSEGNRVPPVVGVLCPSDQPGEPWPAGVLTTPLEMAVQMDVYDGPQGTGYVATVTVNVLGKTYQRAQNVGPETYRTYDWREYVPRVVP